MKFLIVLALVGIATSQKCGLNDNKGASSLSTAAFWKGIDGADKIEELTDKTFAAYVKKDQKTFVLFYHPRCRYCIESREGFAGAAKEMDGQVFFASVDCSKQRKACQVQGHPIRGYPTFFYYAGGEWNDEYNGQRDTNSFVGYLNTK
ncbi:thioredoxin domain-containing protein 5 [Folsomia candida]|uniref:DnaJ subfamily C member 10 n=1 Tax=Folsomia candida TaxID=158441 RepID=A0A226D4U2_FOLCA|nr:thioredoxin domain-containing protein 5 [Folsomia candida]OXA40203.1 DnaJ subfamily C member 10 [Folsomia candida]